MGKGGESNNKFQNLGEHPLQVKRTKDVKVYYYNEIDKFGESGRSMKSGEDQSKVMTFLAQIGDEFSKLVKSGKK